MHCSYTIPGENGNLEEGKRLLNYVWYMNIANDSRELHEALTDSEGRKHHHTLPIGKMQSRVWEQQCAKARQILPSAFAELVEKTMQPFVSAISDINVSKAVMGDGKILIVGDSLMPFRPHVACSTNQAAFNALLLAQMLKGEINLAFWESQVLDYAHATRLRSITWGCWYQIGYLAFFASEAKYLAELAKQGLRSMYRWALGR